MKGEGGGTVIKKRKASIEGDLKGGNLQKKPRGRVSQGKKARLGGPGSTAINRRQKKGVSGVGSGKKGRVNFYGGKN